MTYLDRILAAHRDAASGDHRDPERLLDEARVAGPVRDFRAALVADAGVGVIAEIKRRSPSKGDLHADLDPMALAGAYARGGASCLSVLTDVAFFGGSADDLRLARKSVDLPVLRKDFTVTAADVCDARIMGADAVLLIVAALDDAELADFHDLATELGLAALIEVHDEAEVERALGVGASLIGVNQRDLVSFEVDTDRAVRVAGSIPGEVVRVAESGIRDADDVRRLAEAGYDAVLVGETLVTAPDPTGAVGALRRVGRSARPTP